MYIMDIKTFNDFVKTNGDFVKTYCFFCDKMTQTKNKRKEDFKEYQILKGECEECNEIKIIDKKFRKKINIKPLFI